MKELQPLRPMMRHVIVIVVSVAALCGVWLGKKALAQPAGRATNTPIFSASVDVDSVVPAKAPDLVDTQSDAKLEQAEEELKRMEAELLKKIGASQPSVTESPARTTSPAATKLPAIPPPDLDRASFAIKDIPEPQTPSASETSNVLKELENHPAIGGKSSRSRHPTPGSSTNTVPTPIEKSDTENRGDVTQRLAIAESQVKILTRELDTTRSSLQSAERRIDELSAMLKAEQTATPFEPAARTVAIDQKPQTIKPDRDPWETASAEEFTPKTHTVPVVVGAAIDSDGFHTPRASNEASIVVTRTALRIGPSRTDSILFLVSKNDRVTIEDRTGEWYRVMTPNGTRGWLIGSALAFAGNGEQSGSTIRIRAFNPKYERISAQF